jgi:photosystem II stability/assembly factor-like uncharacterized protein
MKPLLAVFALLAAGNAAAVAAGLPQWHQIGPPGSPLAESLAFDLERPAIAFAGSSRGGIARSEDAGLTWRPSSQGLTEPGVTHLIVHPRISDLVFGQSGQGRLVRSVDGGANWQEILVTSSGLSTFAPAPTDPELVYAAAPEGVLVSRDQGSHWRRVGGGGLPLRYRATALAVDARDPHLVYAGIADYTGFGLWASEDSGRTWQRRLHGIPEQLIADPQRSGTVYLLKSGRLQRSRDRGLTWESYFAPGAVAVAFKPRHPWIAYVVAGQPVGTSPVWKTTDDGAHWQPVSGLSGTGFFGALAVNSEDVVLFSSDAPNGFSRSTDAGASWAAAGNGLINSSVASLAVDGRGTLFASRGREVARTRDGGLTWSSVLQTPTALTTVAVDPQQPAVVYATTLYPFGLDPHIVWKSSDGGDTWSPLPYPQPARQPLAGLHAVDLAVDPFDSQVIYLVTQYAVAGIPGGEGVYRSPDGGQTWAKTSLPARDFSGVTPAVARRGPVWAIWLDGAYKSTDSGQTWSLLLPASPNLYLQAVAPAPSNPDVVWVAGDNVTYRSADGGATWQTLPGLIGWPYFAFTFFSHPLAVDPADPGIIYTAWQQGVSRFSLATGWQPVDDGLFNRDAACILFDAADPERLLVGTNGAGAFELHTAPP